MDRLASGAMKSEMAAWLAKASCLRDGDYRETA